MTITAFTHEIKARLIRLLADGMDADDVAEEIGSAREHVIAIAKNHGYPDVDKLAWAADIMEKNIADGVHAPASIDRSARRQPPTPATILRTTAPADIGALLHHAKGHPAKRIQAAADQILDRLSKLRDLIAEDTQKNAARRQAEAAKAEARAEVERLEQQLADAKAKLRGPKVTSPAPAASTTGTPPAAEIRAWAAEAGVHCPKSGRVPADVRTAYLDAHTQAAS